MTTDPAVNSFPAAIDFPMNSGTPLVWVYNPFVTGVIICFAPWEKVGPVVTLQYGSHRRRDLLTRAGNVRAVALSEGTERDDRWRIDLRTPAGFAYGLRWLHDNGGDKQITALRIASETFWFDQTTDADRLALAQAMTKAQGGAA
jgi:hypothetical protein